MKIKNKEALKEQKENVFVSNAFKGWVMITIFLLVFIHLYSIIKYPQFNILPKEVMLSIVLVLVGYIWVQDFRDSFRLRALNESLIATQNQLQQSQVDTIAVLILTEEAKSPYLRGHSKIVAHCAQAIAQKMDLPEERQKILWRAALLHDLGKLSIEDVILNKPDKLSDLEWRIMRGHPQRAVEVLQPLDFLYEEKKIILHHHERYDGGGYPFGLEGEKIPLESRIITVADCFDAMISERPYRKALTKETVLFELKKGSGNQFDPSVVGVFIKILEKNPHLWSRDYL